MNFSTYLIYGLQKDYDFLDYTKGQLKNLPDNKEVIRIQNVWNETSEKMIKISRVLQVVAFAGIAFTILSLDGVRIPSDPKMQMLWISTVLASIIASACFAISYKRAAEAFKQKIFWSSADNFQKLMVEGKAWIGKEKEQTGPVDLTPIQPSIDAFTKELYKPILVAQEQRARNLFFYI